MSRLPLILLAAVSLVAGLWTGLVRAGVALAPPSGAALAAHGGLMIGGALGTLIALERAVALDEPWAYLAPITSGAAALGAVVGLPWPWVTWGLVLASAFFVLVNLRVVARQFADFTATMTLGAVAWLAGNWAWASGRSGHELVLLWAAFLVLTIAGERLELSRLRAPPKRAAALFGVLALLLVAGAITTLSSAAFGARLAGGSLTLLALWLARYDVARVTWKREGLPRFVAVCLYAGYFWLLSAGALLLVGGALLPGLYYDACLHALFLGFVFSMIFGHAPIILPAVLGVEIPFTRALYGPLALLHASLAARVAFDLLGYSEWRGPAAVANVVALASYAGTVLSRKLRLRSLARRSERPAAAMSGD